MVATLNGPDGQTVLGPASLTIGRVPGNQLLVNDARASSHHAEIRPDGQAYSIIDLGSTNGTFINEQRLLPNIPRPLQSGDIVRIGDTRFTYGGMNESQLGPIVYASSSPGSSSNYPPPIIPPPPSPNFNYAPPVAPPPPAYAAYAAVGQQGVYPPPAPPAPVPAQKPSRIGLWITLGVIVGVLVIGAIVIGVIGYMNRSTPTRTENGASRINSTQPRSTPSLTLSNYCGGIKSGDYQTAYSQLSRTIQSQATEAQFAASFTTIKRTDCVVSNVNDTAGTGQVTNTYSSSATETVNFTLAQENGTWKINVVIRNPTETLNAFCSALKHQDYLVAYGQLSSYQRSLATEARFAAMFGTTTVTDCTVSNVDDNAGTGTISYTFSNGSTSTIDYTLVNENGVWGINTGKQHV